MIYIYITKSPIQYISVFEILKKKPSKFSLYFPIVPYIFPWFPEGVYPPAVAPPASQDYTVAAGGNAVDVARLEHIPRWSQHFLPKGGDSMGLPTHFLGFPEGDFFSFSPWEIHFLGNLWGICLIFEWFLQQIHVFWKKIVGLMWLKQCHLHHPPVRKAFFLGGM